MADTKLTALGTVAAASDDDLLYLVNDPGGSAGSYQVSRSGLLSAKINTAEMSVGGPTTATATNVSGTVSGSVGIFASGSIGTLTGARYTADGTVAGTSAVFGTVTINAAIAVTSGDAATQAEQETGTAINKFVTPGRQQYHPTAAKFWIAFNGTGTPAVLSSYNAGSITDNGTGDYNIEISTDFSAANQCFVCSAGHTSAGDNQMQFEVGDVGVGTVGVYATQGGALVDFAYLSIIAFGDQ